MIRRGTSVTAICLSLTALIPPTKSIAAEPPTKSAANWKDVAKDRGFSAEDIARIEREKVLITGETFRQVFDPYLKFQQKARVPAFITTDSILNAFHVLFEESFLRLEEMNAGKLSGILLRTWTHLDKASEKLLGRPDLVAEAKVRARTVLAVALHLLEAGEGIELDDATSAVVKEETGRVLAASERTKPAWLGAPDRGFHALDYSRYKPRGFYTRSKELERYFRTVSWLQSIPFRIDKDEELTTILLLGAALEATGEEERREQQNFFRCFKEVVGTGDDWDAIEATFGPWIKLEELPKKRDDLIKWATRFGKRPQINDLLAFAQEDPSSTVEVGYRFIAAARLPDAILFGRTTDIRAFPDRKFPEALEVCAALGSSFARARLAGQESGKVLAAIDGCRALFSARGINCEYLGCLAALLDEPEPDAPPLFRSEPWMIKSCQTALSGWAQMRHTFILQAKESAGYGGSSEAPPGFVEPEPEFFSRLARLVLHGKSFFDRQGALAVDYRRAVPMLREMARLIRSGEDEPYLVHQAKWLGFYLDVEVPLGDQEAPSGWEEKLTKKIGQLADAIEKGLAPAPKVAEFLNGEMQDIGPLWSSLVAVARQLETLAHKQLRGISFSKDEEDFIARDYGESLGSIMLYGGNLYLTPRDDAPRAADVFSDAMNSGKYLIAATGKPHALYVLYPWKGKEILCRGAVLPFHEFQSATRLTDAEWMKLLGSKDRPDDPAWVKPILSRTPTKDPARDRK